MLIANPTAGDALRTHRAPTTALAMASLAAVAAIAFAATPATGLAPGKAKGTINVNGKAVSLTHAYAALEPNPFDEKKSDIVIVLTDRALDAAALAGDLSDATGNLKNYLRLKMRDDPEMAKNFGLERWMVGNRTLGHEVLKDKALQTSPDFGSKVDVVVMGPDRAEGTVYTAKVEDSFGEKFEYRVSFNAKVKARAK